MSQVPPDGWMHIRLGDILLDIEAGKSFTCEPRRADVDEWGVIKVSAMTWGKFDEDENKAIPANREPDPRYEIHPGDILVSRANTEAYVGAPVLVGQCRPQLLLSDKSLRLVPSDEVDRRWLVHTLASPAARSQISAKSTGAQESMRNISQSALADVEICLPPLAEQRRIVETLEDHLSRLEVGERLLRDALARCHNYRRNWLWATTHNFGAPAVRLDTVAEVRLGRQRSPKNHVGDSMYPYLRAANIVWSGLKLDDVKEMNFTAKEVETYRLQDGDILLSEASGSPSEVGKPALWQGEIEDCCFQNTLIRVRPTGVRPDFLLHYLRSEAMTGRFIDQSRGVGIHHLGAATLAAWQVCLPDAGEQAKIAALIEETEPVLTAVEKAITKQQRRAKHLRSALLAAAASGKLVPQNPADEPAAEQLKRTKVERPNQPKRRAAKNAAPNRAATRSPVVAKTMAPPKTSAFVLAGIQEELPL